MPSTVIAHMDYDPVSAVLRITYVSGMVYDYLDVPPHVFADLKKSSSKGSFLNQQIKGHYEFEKIKEIS